MSASSPPGQVAPISHISATISLSASSAFGLDKHHPSFTRHMTWQQYEVGSKLETVDYKGLDLDCNWTKQGSHCKASSTKTQYSSRPETVYIIIWPCSCLFFWQHNHVLHDTVWPCTSIWMADLTLHVHTHWFALIAPNPDTFHDWVQFKSCKSPAPPQT